MTKLKNDHKKTLPLIKNIQYVCNSYVNYEFKQTYDIKEKLIDEMSDLKGENSQLLKNEICNSKIQEFKDEIEKMSKEIKKLSAENKILKQLIVPADKENKCDHSHVIMNEVFSAIIVCPILNQSN